MLKLLIVKIIMRSDYENAQSAPPWRMLSGLWLNPMGLSITRAALALGVSRKTLSKIVNGNSGISPEMAFRLSMAFGGRPESWMGPPLSTRVLRVSTG